MVESVMEVQAMTPESDVKMQSPLPEDSNDAEMLFTEGDSVNVDEPVCSASFQAEEPTAK